MRFGQESTAFMISGISSRLAQLLRLDSEPTPESLEGIPSGLLIAEKEARRRLVWSCYIQDVAISSGVDLISSWPLAPKARLPCSDREFTLQLECDSGILGEGKDFDDEVSQSKNMSLEAAFVHIIYLRKQVLRLVPTCSHLRNTMTETRQLDTRKGTSGITKVGYTCEKLGHMW